GMGARRGPGEGGGGPAGTVGRGPGTAACGRRAGPAADPVPARPRRGEQAAAAARPDRLALTGAGVLSVLPGSGRKRPTRLGSRPCLPSPGSRRAATILSCAVITPSPPVLSRN